MPEGSISFPYSPTHFPKSECAISFYGDVFQYGFGGDTNSYTISTCHRPITSRAVQGYSPPPTHILENKKISRIGIE